jgi:hypothetical protein
MYARPKAAPAIAQGFADIGNPDGAKQRRAR